MYDHAHVLESDLVWHLLDLQVWIYFTTWKKRKSSLLSCQVNIVILEAMTDHISYSKDCFVCRVFHLTHTHTHPIFEHVRCSGEGGGDVGHTAVRPEYQRYKIPKVQNTKGPPTRSWGPEGPQNSGIFIKMVMVNSSVTLHSCQLASLALYIFVFGLGISNLRRWCLKHCFFSLSQLHSILYLEEDQNCTNSDHN